MFRNGLPRVNRIGDPESEAIMTVIIAMGRNTISPSSKYAAILAHLPAGFCVLSTSQVFQEEIWKSSELSMAGAGGIKWTCMYQGDNPAYVPANCRTEYDPGIYGVQSGTCPRIAPVPPI